MADPGDPAPCISMKEHNYSINRKSGINEEIVEVEIKSKNRECKNCRCCHGIDRKANKVECHRHKQEALSGCISVVPYQEDCRFFKNKIVQKRRLL